MSTDVHDAHILEKIEYPGRGKAMNVSVVCKYCFTLFARRNTDTSTPEFPG